jgi:hypothetical protein
VHGKNVRDESRDPEKRRDDPMASETIEENVTCGKQCKGGGVDSIILRAPRIVTKDTSGDAARLP